MSRNMIHKTLLILGLASLVLMTGCLEGYATRTGAYLPPKPAYAPIDVYIDADPLHPWTEIGLVSGRGTNHNAYEDDVIHVLQDQARHLGADAVIVTDQWLEEDIYYDSDGYAHIREELVMHGIAIIYL